MALNSMSPRQELVILCSFCTDGRSSGSRGSRSWSDLQDRFTLIAPDLRGFGKSDKPVEPFGPPDHAKDMIALLDVFGIKRAGVVGHDVGGAIMQPLARSAPDRLLGLFFFDFVYPGIGPRMAEPDRLKEIWYQSFNQTAMAPTLVGATRHSCETYIGHFLRHWAYRKDAFDSVLDSFHR